MIQYEIVDADEEVTRQVAEISRESSRHFDLIAALEFHLARDPVSYSTRVPGFQSQVYATWTNAGFPELPRVLFWYVIEEHKIIRYGVSSIEDEESTA